MVAVGSGAGAVGLAAGSVGVVAGGGVWGAAGAVGGGSAAEPWAGTAPVSSVAGAARGKPASVGFARAPSVSMSTCTRWASTHARARSSGDVGGSPSAASSSKFRFSEGAEKRRVVPLSRSPVSGPRPSPTGAPAAPTGSAGVAVGASLLELARSYQGGGA
ncbi:hypothetical protein ACFYWS_36330 [Streptomyces sp. NPDC002795]|uniref:hypothetical protein n=1 Tax=Streptomyces sp. NPDC002795 TaxID=3364665 RepID=UPI0036AB08F0